MDIVDLIERLGVTGVLVFMCVLFIHKFVNTDKKVDRMHRRFDSLKDELHMSFEDVKDEISDLNKDLLRSCRKNGI